MIIIIVFIFSVSEISMNYAVELIYPSPIIDLLLRNWPTIGPLLIYFCEIDIPQYNYGFISAELTYPSPSTDLLLRYWPTPVPLLVYFCNAFIYWLLCECEVAQQWHYE